jgi:hypothetical protein
MRMRFKNREDTESGLRRTKPDEKGPERWPTVQFSESAVRARDDVVVAFGALTPPPAPCHHARLQRTDGAKVCALVMSSQLFHPASLDRAARGHVPRGVLRSWNGEEKASRGDAFVSASVDGIMDGACRCRPTATGPPRGCHNGQGRTVEQET